jgi:hypothetical protein
MRSTSSHGPENLLACMLKMLAVLHWWFIELENSNVLDYSSEWFVELKKQQNYSSCWMRL